MAQTATKKKTNGTGKKSSGGRQSTPKKPEREENPARRIIAAACLAFAAVLVVIGIFAHDGVVVSWLCSLLKGLFGYGFWICAPAFLLSAYTLGFHRDEPAAWRTTAALMLPLLIGSLLDPLLGKVVIDNSNNVFAAIKELYVGGTQMQCGGVLSGLLAFVLQKAFSIYGAAIILFFVLAIFALSSVGITPAKLIELIRTEPEEKPAKKKTRPAPVEDDEPEEAPVEETEPVKKPKRRAIDIPLDDEPAFNKSAMPSPP